MKRRLSAWWRLGIVLSVFWMIGGPIYFSGVDHNQRNETIRAWYALCNEQRGRLAPNEDCGAEMRQSYEQIDHSFIWRNSALIAAILAVLAWIAFGILYGCTRWILAGRKRVEKAE